MKQDHVKKEALFNEVKGSLFEYLLAKSISQKSGNEVDFQSTLDSNYLSVLSQQDRMIRQFYPEMLSFLKVASEKASEALLAWLKETPRKARLTGKLSNHTNASEWHEADLLLELQEGSCPLSLKLNKKNSFVNTKSGGIKSFFQHYFSFLSPQVQSRFNQLVDMEFNRMALELHHLHDLEYPGNFSSWVESGLSEHPGELPEEDRQILKSYYARLAQEMHTILSEASRTHPEAFGRSLAPLMGFGSEKIIQLICFHEFKTHSEVTVDIHRFSEIAGHLSGAEIRPFGNIASVELQVGHWSLQIRIKPMNKFTTTAVKINCSIRVRG